MQLFCGLPALFMGCGVLCGATYTVNAGGGGNYTTIQSCANTAVAGDTCTVYAGTYNEGVTLSHSGTGTGAACTACVTFQANAGDTVNVYGFTVSANYLIIKGFTITDPTLNNVFAGVFFTGSSAGVQILNNTITQVGQNGYACIHTDSNASHYLTITGNTISWCDSTPGGANVKPGSQAIDLVADHSLVASNDMSHVLNALAVGGTNNAVVGNYYHDVNDAVDFPGCHEVNNCDTHVDMIEAGSSVNLLIERNQQNNTIGVGGAHNILYSGSVSGESIHRFNVISNNGEGMLGVQGGYSGVYSYNNTAVNTALEGPELGTQTNAAVWFGSPNGSYLNELMYKIIYPSGTTGSYYFVDSGSVSGFTGGHNLGFDPGCSAGTLAGCTSGLMLTDTGNIYADPQFVDPTGDFHLQTGSPALGSGTYLTTVAAGDSGSGTALIVNNAGFFQDGYGIAGVNADWIRVGASTTAQVSSINYSTNTITLAGAINRSVADPVYLYKDSSGNVVLTGSAPNIGALPAVSSPPTITSTSPLPNGDVAVPYSYQFTATGTAPITWSATGVPAWAMLSSSGLLSGTPTSVTNYTLNVTATNSAGSAGPTAFTLSIKRKHALHTADMSVAGLNIR